MHTPPATCDTPLAPNAFETAWRVRYSEVGHQGTMTPTALVNAFQDVSTLQSETLGRGLGQLYQTGHAWVLMHWDIVVERYPRLFEDVVAGTFANRFRGVTGERTFYLRDHAGTLLARANSTWAYLDLATGRPCRPAPADIEPYGSAPALAMPAGRRHIDLPDEFVPGEPFAICPSQIDTNEHVNNAQYVQMALDAAGGDQAPARLRVSYHRAAHRGDTVHPRVGADGTRRVIALDDAAGAPFAVVELS